MPRQASQAVFAAEERLKPPPWPLKKGTDVFDRSGVCLFVSNSPKLYALSNYYNKCEIKIFGYVFTSSEQAYYFAKLSLAKLHGDAMHVKNESDPYVIKRIAKDAEGKPEFRKFQAIWESIKLPVLRGICYKKFAQNPLLMDLLKATGTYVLGEATSHPFFGIGRALSDPLAARPDHWRGMNMLGQILEEIRSGMHTENFVVGDSLTNVRLNQKDTTVVCAPGIGLSGALLLASCVVEPKSAKVLIHAGTNDTSRKAEVAGKAVPPPLQTRTGPKAVQFVAVDVTKVLQQLPILADRFSHENPGMKVVLSGCLPRHAVEREKVGTNLKKISAAMKTYVMANGHDNFQYLDASEGFEIDDYKQDGIHLENWGKSKLAARFKFALSSQNKVMI